MEFVALETFAGKVSAHKGATVIIKDKAVAKDLVKAGYVKPVNVKKTSKKAKAEAGAE